MIRRGTRDVAAIIRDGTAIDAAIERAQRRVMIGHRQLGIPIAIWREGRVVEVPPESIPVPEEDIGRVDGTGG